MDLKINEQSNIIKSVMILVTIVSVFFLVRIFSEVKNYKFIGQGANTINQISFEGEGEVFAVPDIANIHFSAREEGKTISDSQKLVAVKMDKAISFLKESGIAEKDIKTTNFNSYPKYENQNIVCISYPCVQPNPKIIGYETTQSISVKIRNTDDAGKIIEGLGTASISDISGPDFSIDDETKLQAEARKKAIQNAKEKAEILSKDLGVRLVRIVSFSENAGYQPYMFNTAKASLGMAESAPSLDLPVGENKITSRVNITYEIR